MSDVWNVLLRLGSWHCPVAIPRELFDTAQDANNFAVQAVIDARDQRERIHELESQLSTAFEIMTDRQIAENQHLFNSHIDIEHSGSTTKTVGEN